jgi:hypothetical protein
MSNIFFFIAILLVALWAVGFFVFSMGTFIHLLLVLGLVSLFLRLYMGAKTTYEESK